MILDFIFYATDGEERDEDRILLKIITFSVCPREGGLLNILYNLYRNE